MKKVLAVYILLTVGVINMTSAQERLQRDQLLYDLNFYEDSLAVKHINAFSKISKTNFNRRIEHLRNKISSISEDEFIVELLKINALIGDEHTNIFPSFEFEMPLQVERFYEGLTIIAADSINDKYLLHRILSVDNVPIEKITAQLKTIVKQDNPSFTKLLEVYFFNKPQILKGLGIARNEKNVTLQLLSPSDDTVNAQINSTQGKRITRWMSAPQFRSLLAYTESSNYWFVVDKNSNAVYFNYKRCIENDDEKFEAFNKRLFDTIKDLKPGKLVLDLRFNSGGNSDVLKPFINSIKSSYLNKAGHFFILVGRRVASSSMMNAIELKKTTKAIFVGEPTGGNINHYGELRSFELPNTKANVTYSTKYWQNWKNHNGPLIPDISASNSLFDFIASKDKALDIIFGK